MIRQYSKYTRRLFSSQIVGSGLAVDQSKKPINSDSLPKLDKKLYFQPVLFATNPVAQAEETREQTFERYLAAGTQILFPDETEIELCKDLVERHGIWDPLVGRSIGPTGVWTEGDRLKQNEATALLRTAIEERKKEKVDFVSCNQFQIIGEAQAALKLMAELGVPSFVTFKTDEEGKLPCGTLIEDACEKMDESGAFLVGLEAPPEVVARHVWQIRRNVGCFVGVICDFDNTKEYEKEYWHHLFKEMHFTYAVNYLGINGCEPELLQEIIKYMNLTPIFRKTKK